MPKDKKMGRPIIGEPKNRVIQLRLDETSLRKLNTLSKKRN
ncbi:hypothetical protein [Bulleidia sp. zg-1006]|nr:hypothetical protein [Bulleidia sp. zg-1006]